MISEAEILSVVRQARTEHGGEPPPFTLPACRTAADWIKRDIPPPDYLLGWWLTTTTRALLSAPTGAGKSNLVLAIAAAVAAGADFLHWRGWRPARVLYVDGEMSRRLLKVRVADACRRLGRVPETLFALSTEDVEAFKPLNTPEGQAYFDQVVAVLEPELVIFDNLMSLLSGVMKDEEAWRTTQPWANTLTAKGIGQIWVHHCGHDASRFYGSSTIAWQQNASILLQPVERPDTDVSFNLTFAKKRDATPDTRDDFGDVRVALVHDRWEVETSTKTAKTGKVSPMGEKFYDALVDALSLPEAERRKGRAVATNDQWKAECIRHGLIDPDANAHSARTLFAKYRRELIAANRIGAEIALNWMVAQ